MTVQRFLALMVMLIPVVTAGYGIKLMRDTMFDIINTPFPNLMIQFFVGGFLFAGGIWFFAGFILRRDRRNKRVAEKFQQEQQRENGNAL
ncbi:DUF2627 domain-containing protein [Alkalicoccus chagannorensis]|uniref:DUF2627 domain-containing protein n=1 Tax=Alkalicoccus chagannorensis TaxID=427072 RepID=UPI000406D0D5|nr:DUF2627 domain-containing protein [Alkalicoccus chagannorensis]